MRTYKLTPNDSRKSFYGKAKVVIDEQGETLFSYDTAILRRDSNGNLTRLWFEGWTATTGRHIAAFCGLNKREFLSLK